MNYNFINQLLDNGINEEELIASIAKTVPRLAKKTRQMMLGGWSPKEILNLFSKYKEVQKTVRKGLKPTTPSEMAAMHLQNSYSNIPKSQGDITKENLTEFTKQAAPYALGYAGSKIVAPMAEAALSRALPKLEGLAKNVIPEAVRKQVQQMGTGGQLSNQLNNAETQQPPLGLGNASIQQPANIQQPEVISNPKEYLEKAGVLDTVNDHLKRGTSPEGIATLLSTNMNKKGRLGGKVDPELLKNIEDYAKKAQEQPQELAAIEEEKPIEPVKIEKNSVVSSPQGVGEVKEIRNGQAIIDVDGKLHKVKEEDLEPPLYSDDEIADAYDNLMAKIPEKERSGFISWAGYDENTNELGFIPRGGKYEVITDISPEEAKAIKEGTGTARTSGEVREGLWVQGGETRGGVISQIIWDRKKKREAEEKKQGKFDFDLPKPEKQDRGMKPQFDEMAYARNLSRAREKRAKDEERARKKKEKDEAKKRKK